MTSELARRVVFGIIAAPIAIGIVLAGGAPLAALLAVASALAAWEFYRIAAAVGLAPFPYLGAGLAGVVPLVVHARYLHVYDPDRSIPAISLAMLVVLAIFAIAIWTRGTSKGPLGAVAATVFGVAYTGGMLSFAYAIRYHDYASGDAASLFGVSWAFRAGIAAGGLLLALPLILTWASDIGAYAVGRSAGRHKLMPTVSPGKTVEGAAGGLLAAALIGWLYTDFVLQPATSLAFRGRLLGVLAFSLLISAAAQVGDLAESMLKREAGVKDSSALIPGTGGVLDRLDSLLFVLPVAYVLFGLLLTWAPL